MSTRTRTLSLALALALGAPLAASAQNAELIIVPNVDSVQDITPDGKMIVGWGHPDEAFYWRWQEDPAPVFIGGHDAVAVSDDGTVILGNINYDWQLGTSEAALWTEATGWQSLGFYPGSTGCGWTHGHDMSGDGSVVVGITRDENCDYRAFRWTQATGLVVLEHMGSSSDDTAAAIAADGSLMAGHFNDPTRTPVIWSPDGTGQQVGGGVWGEVRGISDDGSLFVGEHKGDGLTGQSQGRAFYQTPGGSHVEIGNLNGAGFNASAVDVIEGGGMIVGFDYYFPNTEAWVWTPQSGILQLQGLLGALGVPNVPHLGSPSAVTPDGRIIVGQNGALFPLAWIAVLFDEDTWTDLGGGTAGINGVPELVGSGTLDAGTTASLTLTGAPASTLMLAWMSFSSIPQNYFGGTIHATPFANQFLFGSDPAGSFNASTTWPAGVPAGTEVWFQFIVSDPSVLWDITLSNAVKATTP